MQDITQEIHHYIYVFILKKTRETYTRSSVGKQGADKRIDVLSMAMMNNATVDDLTEFEVAYAPPYSHPKDLINLIGYKAQ